MTISEVEEKFDKLILSLRICEKNEYIESTLILLYSMIDSLAWLNSDKEDIKERQVGKEFESFTGKYILKYLKYYNITSNELYNARCGMVHTMMSCSKNKSIKYIVYANNENSQKENDKKIKAKGYNAVCINIFDLLCAVTYAYKDFFEEMKNNNIKIKKIINKAENYYTIF